MVWEASDCRRGVSCEGHRDTRGLGRMLCRGVMHPAWQCITALSPSLVGYNRATAVIATVPQACLVTILHNPMLSQTTGCKYDPCDKKVEESTIVLRILLQRELLVAIAMVIYRKEVDVDAMQCPAAGSRVPLMLSL